MEMEQVAERFIKAVRESANPSMKMSFFINYDANDTLRQAIDSTLRYQQGTINSQPRTLNTYYLIPMQDCKNKI